jgi:hypothetical protein
VAEGDGAAVDVDPVRGQAEILCRSNTRLRG